MIETKFNGLYEEYLEISFLLANRFDVDISGLDLVFNGGVSEITPDQFNAIIKIYFNLKMKGGFEV